MPDGERRLAAIMFTDIVGYTALTQRNESEMMRLLEEHRRLIRPLVSSHGGREIKTIGDAFLLEFPSALDALFCAVSIQQVMHDRKVARGDALSLRIGIHVGDVIEKGNDILGDAVNIASRIEPLAEPEGVCISAQVYDQVRNKSDLPFISLGEKSLKNVGVPTGVYAVRMPWSSHGPTQPIRLDRKRVAVLPLANISPDPADEYFADGMTEELIGTLSKVQELRVISHTSVMRYKSRSKPVPEVGRELNAGTVLEGSVRKMGNRVRVSIQMIATTEDEHLWAENYDRTLEDVFAIQSEIAKRIADELRIKLAESERSILERRPTGNTEAYERYLQGREEVRRGGEESLRRAIDLFRKAIELDPLFARAHSSLADCYLGLGNAGFEPYEESIARAKAPLHRALELDPSLADAHATLSLLHMNEDDFKGLEAEARRAIELNPSLPEPYEWLANISMLKEDINETVRLIETSYHLDPARPRYIANLGAAYFYTGREREALDHWKRTAELAPATTYMIMAEYYLWKGDYGSAKERITKAMELEPNSNWVRWLGGFLAARTGDKDAAFREIKEIEDSKGGAVRLCDIAFVHYALGDLDSYFDYLEQALELHAIATDHVMYCPLFADARTDQRYRALLEKAKKML